MYLIVYDRFWFVYLLCVSITKIIIIIIITIKSLLHRR